MGSAQAPRLTVALAIVDRGIDALAALIAFPPQQRLDFLLQHPLQQRLDPMPRKCLQVLTCRARLRDRLGTLLLQGRCLLSRALPRPRFVAEPKDAPPSLVYTPFEPTSIRPSMARLFGIGIRSIRIVAKKRHR
jgi:hypothetical protein